MASKHTPAVLTIAGSDPYGGAGIQIDSKTIHRLGGYAFTVITALTAQNSTGVKALHNTPSKILKDQLSAILDDIRPDAVKIGMLGSDENVEVVADIISRYRLCNIVLDPIISSTSGTALLSADGIEAMKERLFPLADLITPNLPEYEILSGHSIEIEAIRYSGIDMIGTKAILLKGGHGSGSSSTDYLMKDSSVYTFSSSRVGTTHTHGTGCILSSAIATHLAYGNSIKDSVELAKSFLYKNLVECSLNFRYNTDKENRKEPLF